jgi:RNA polymerase sigma factor for flagellar operon FliA
MKRCIKRVSNLDGTQVSEIESESFENYEQKINLDYDGFCEVKDFDVNEKVWNKYKLTHNIELRNKILMKYLNIVKINAKRMSAMYRNHADLEDIVNQGVFVLMDCIEKFDPNRSVKFDTFASIRIRGSIIDYIRKQDWVPRNVRKKAKTVGDAFSELQITLGRNASEKEVAEHLGTGVDEINKILGEASGFSVLSYEELIQDHVSIYKDDNILINSPELQLQEEELKKIVASSIDMLNENERIVISLYYYEELKLKEISEVLGLSQSRISQLHSKALMKIKGTVQKYIEI